MTLSVGLVVGVELGLIVGMTLKDGDGEGHPSPNEMLDDSENSKDVPSCFCATIISLNNTM